MQNWFPHSSEHERDRQNIFPVAAVNCKLNLTRYLKYFFGVWGLPGQLSVHLSTDKVKVPANPPQTWQGKPPSSYYQPMFSGQCYISKPLEGIYHTAKEIEFKTWLLAAQGWVFKGSATSLQQNESTGPTHFLLPEIAACFVFLAQEQSMS